jgi:hypothetical protein
MYRHPDGSADYEAERLGRLPTVVQDQLDPSSTAARIAAQVAEDREADAKDQEAVVDQLQADRKAERKRRARTAGLSSAEILAASARR